MTDKRTLGLPLPLSEVLESGLERGREERLWASIRARRGMGGHSEPPKAGQYLPARVGDVLEPADMAADRSRLWRQIAARRKPARSARPLYAFSFGAVALAAALMVFWISPSGRKQAALNSAAKPLVQANGAVFTALDATDRARVVKLADASEIRLDRGARLEGLFSSGSRFELLLARGSAEFSVTPGGPRRWVIEAGVATVEVLGTVFRVTRTADGVDVSVTRGVVLVRGDSVNGRVQKLTAGHFLHVAPSENDKAKEAGAEAARVEPQPIVTQHPALATPVKLAPVRLTASRTQPWRQHLHSGSYSAAYEALGAKGLTREIAQASTMEQLLELADVARLSGHPGEAVPALERALGAHGQHPQAALAAFTLGRVELDQLNHPKAAAEAFERAITMRPPAALLADCHARLVEAFARAGDKEAAERAASRYRTMFPAGRHTTDLDRWTNE